MYPYNLVSQFNQPQLPQQWAAAYGAAQGPQNPALYYPYNAFAPQAPAPTGAESRLLDVIRDRGFDPRDISTFLFALPAGVSFTHLTSQATGQLLKSLSDLPDVKRTSTLATFGGLLAKTKGDATVVCSYCLSTCYFDVTGPNGRCPNALFAKCTNTECNNTKGNWNGYLLLKGRRVQPADDEPGAPPAQLRNAAPTRGRRTGPADDDGARRTRANDDDLPARGRRNDPIDDEPAVAPTRRARPNDDDLPAAAAEQRRISPRLGTRLA